LALHSPKLPKKFPEIFSFFSPSSVEVYIPCKHLTGAPLRWLAEGYRTKEPVRFDSLLHNGFSSVPGFADERMSFFLFTYDECRFRWHESWRMCYILQTYSHDDWREVREGYTLAASWLWQSHLPQILETLVAQWVEGSPLAGMAVAIHSRFPSLRVISTRPMLSCLQSIVGSLE
jgi:hypothetical protein